MISPAQLKITRASLSMTQLEFAARIGITSRHYQSLEAGAEISRTLENAIRWVSQQNGYDVPFNTQNDMQFHSFD